VRFVDFDHPARKVDLDHETHVRIVEQLGKFDPARRIELFFPAVHMDVRDQKNG
jgi:hypothetical protein